MTNRNIERINYATDIDQSWKWQHTHIQTISGPKTDHTVLLILLF